MNAQAEIKPEDRIENWKGKTVMIVTPHPDDDTFSSGGTLAKLAKNGNKIVIVIYTSDNAGSNDPEMTKEKLAAIRKKEEEEACRILGIPADAITWFNYDDGMLEYVDKRELTKQMAREIRRHRPDAVFSIDPGVRYDQYHKSDHRSGAMITADAMRAAGWRLYFPELEKEGFKAYSVPVCYFYYSEDPNYTVDITDIAQLKAEASAAHTSQFGELVKKYNPNPTKEYMEELKKRLMASPILFARSPNGFVEHFRRAEGYGE